MKKSVLRVASISAVAALIATLAPMTANAATQPAWDTTTDGNVYLMNNTSAAQIAAGTQLAWTFSNGIVLTASPVPASLGDLSWARFPAPTGAAVDFVPFIAPVGSERTPTAWKQWSAPVALAGTGALLPSVWPSKLTIGDPAGTKAAGGTYSMGIAYTDSAVVASTNVVKAYYTTINVDATTGTWTFATPPAAVVKTDTTTVLSTSATPVAAGDPVTLTATVNSATATGNVNFMDGATSLGTSAAAAGVATLTTSALAAGSHSITAVYAGDSAFNGSTSSAVTVTVTGTSGPDSTLLTTANQATWTSSISGTTATISGIDPLVNGKRVNAYGYTAPSFLGQVTVTGGVAQVNIGSMSAGTHQLALVDATSGAILGWINITITNAAQTANRDLQAMVATSIDGTFALIGPANTSPAVIGNPVLDTLTGESVSTGTLGAFAVKDDRSISKKGWTLTASVNNFVNGTATVSKNALGIKPVFGTLVTGPGLPTLGSERVAGSSAPYPMPFADLAAGTYSTNTDLNAGLTFRAPLGTPAGTYTSTLTLTLVSK